MDLNMSNMTVHPTELLSNWIRIKPHLNHYPYNCIGVVKINLNQNNKKYGVAILIRHKIAITSAQLLNNLTNISNLTVTFTYFPEKILSINLIKNDKK